MSKLYGVIYKATNIVNGKIYIGQTIRSLSRRITEHGKPSSSKSALTRAILKYGKDSFTFEVIDSALTKNDLDSLEMRYISEYGSINKSVGYNIASGGSIGNPFKGFSKEEYDIVKEKISKTLKSKWESSSTDHKMSVLSRLDEGRNKYVSSLTNEDKERMSVNAKKRFSGVKKTLEQRLALSKSKTGLILSFDTIIAMAKKTVKPIPHEYKYTSKARVNPRQPKKSRSKTGSLNPMFGTLGPKNHKSVSIICTNLVTGESCEIVGMQEASRIIGVPATKICAVARGRRRSANGYFFQYADQREL